LPEKEIFYNEIFVKYYSIVLSEVHKYVDSEDDAEDIVQNVFIKYYEKMDEVLIAKSWLYGAARFEVKNYYRKKDRNKTMDINIVCESAECLYQDSMLDARLVLGDVIDSMEKDDQKMFDMIAVRRLTFKEMANTFGYSARQVRYRYSAVEKEILDILRKHGIYKLDDIL
jgi:RNA polymerase sigma-70 factor (ECF subfamily)